MGERKLFLDIETTEIVNGLTKYSKDLMKEIEDTEQNIATIALSNNIVDELITKNQLLNNLKKPKKQNQKSIEKKTPQVY